MHPLVDSIGILDATVRCGSSRGLGPMRRAMKRIALLSAGIALGAVVVLAADEHSHEVRAHLAHWPGLAWLAPVTSTGHAKTPPHDDPEHERGHDDKSLIRLSESQIAA